MKKAVARALIRGFKMFAYGLVGGFLMLVLVGIYALNQKSDLEVWHTADLDEEFSAGGEVDSFAAYLELEGRLFAQLDREVYAEVASGAGQRINRYYRGSLSDPGRWPTDWNRSFELPAAGGEPTAGVLLIHGLSDSPYSLRHLGARLNQAGAHVVGLRVPGHGTAPASLAKTSWQDMAAAIPLATRHLRSVAADRPLYVIGYSNGGALAVHYALITLEDPSLPRVDKLALVSPEIGITPMAGMAIWQERIGRVLGLKKLSWNGIGPKYDPFKYTSFPVNAGNLAYRLTGENRAKIAEMSTAGKLGAFPPVLAFQSAVDATVSAQALVADLMSRLPANGHELVVFDLDRTEGMEELLKADPLAGAGAIIAEPGREFAVSLLTNANTTSGQVAVQNWPVGADSPQVTPTTMAWPAGVYSLSHTALPFPVDDPLYGPDESHQSPGIRLGALALKGEKGVLHIPAGDLIRQRWNPFYSYLESRVDEHFGLGGEGGR